MAEVTIWSWITFNSIVLVLLVLDLFVFHRKAHVVSAREAIGWSLFWIALSCAMGGYIWHVFGSAKGFEFFAGYVIEYSLSIDNIFVFVMIFGYFRVPPEHQHRVLFWGVLGALVMRGVMIGLGAFLVAKFHWVLYLFGAFLLFTAYKMLSEDEEVAEEEEENGNAPATPPAELAAGRANLARESLEAAAKCEDDLPLPPAHGMGQNPFVRFLCRHLPLGKEYHGSAFIYRVDGRLLLTPLALVLILVECTDLIFAVDSIPAIFAITQDPYIVYTSNVCAILGLRSLYFLLAGAVVAMVYLKMGLAVVLAFIGTKMLIAHWVPISTGISLIIVTGILAVAIGCSMPSFLRARRKKRKLEAAR